MNVHTLRAYSLKGSDFDRTQREANVEHTHPRRPPFSLHPLRIRVIIRQATEHPTGKIQGGALLFLCPYVPEHNSETKGSETA